MQILSLKTIQGPNVYHHKPVLVMKVDLGQWAETASNEIPGFNKKIVEIFPGLAEHTCSLGVRGGFLERLKRGTYLAHITEHVAIELSSLCKIENGFGKSVYAHAPGHYNIIVRFVNEEGMKDCLRFAVEAMNAILNKKDFDMQNALKTIQQTIDDTQFGPSTQALIDAAKKRNIPVRHLQDSLLELGYGKQRKRLQTAVSSNTNLIAKDIAQSKEVTKSILARSMIPVCDGVKVRSYFEIKEIESAIKGLQFPLVTKPIDGNHGNGVSLHLNSSAEVYRAIQQAKHLSDDFLIEEMANGKDYRLLVVDYRLVAVAERKPPIVVGDGVSTIQQLIDKENQNPLRKAAHSGFLTSIEIDEPLLQCLEDQSLSLQTVLRNGTEVHLRYNANISTGGTAIDVTDIVHPEIKIMAERVSRIIGLDICGIDLIHNDIKLGINHSTKVIEVNAGPGLRMHLQPSEGSPQPVADAILDMLYPDPKKSRIPIVSITGTNGKTTTTRLIEKICSQNGASVGMTSSDGIWINGHNVCHGDTTGPRSAEVVLYDSSVDYAVLEVARGGIVRNGLAYDWSDVGVIMNIRPDHFGQDGIDTLEDLKWIKSLPIERVREGGSIIANADDPTVMSIVHSDKIKSISRKIVLFSMSENNFELQNHRYNKGTCYWLESQKLFQSINGQTQYIVDVKDIPITLKGTVKFQISNIMASLAAGVAMGFDLHTSVQTIKAFQSNQNNLGRMNMYKVHDSCVILDYGHNPDAIAAIGDILQQYQGFETVVIFGLPGDRSDDLIRQSTKKIAENFNRIVIREDFDLRGRKSGELAAIISDELQKNYKNTKYEVILNTNEAIEKTLQNANKKQIIVIFYDEMEDAMRIVRKFDPVAIDQIPYPLADTKPGFKDTFESTFEENVSSL
jgi:cyanophycin synthetase